MRLGTRLKIECQRLDAWLRQTPYPPISHGFAGSFVEALYRPESGPHAPTGHSLDTCASVQDRPKEAAVPTQGGNRPAREHYIHGPGLRAALLLAERDHARDLAVALEQELARRRVYLYPKERP